MVLDFTSPNCRCASTPAAVMSRVTTVSRSFIELLKLGWIGALLGRAGESPGVAAIRDLGGELGSCDRGGSGALGAGPVGWDGVMVRGRGGGVASGADAGCTSGSSLVASPRDAVTGSGLDDPRSDRGEAVG